MSAERFKRHTYTPNTLIDYLTVMGKAMYGDLAWRITPAVITGTAPTAAAWSREVVVELVTAAGEVHEWFDETLAAGVGIADTSAAGTATLTDGTVIAFENGRGVVEVNGDAAAWLGGTHQVGTMTVTAGATNSGTLTMRVTAAGLAGSPVDVFVPVAAGDSAAEVAERIRTAYEENAAINGFFQVSGTAANVVLTMRTPAANDGTLDSEVQEADGTLVTAAAIVATTAGVAPETVTLTVNAYADLMGQGPGAVTQVETFITPLP